MNKFTCIKQKDSMQCGAACLQMIWKYDGMSFSQDSLSDYCYAATEGVSLLGISDAAEKLGLWTLCGKPTIKQLPERTLPCVLHWHQTILWFYTKQLQIQGRGQ